MARKYGCYQDAIKQIIKVGEKNKLTLAGIIEHPDFARKKEHFSLPDFNKFIRREIRYLIKEVGKSESSDSMALVEEKSPAGKEHYYYWAFSEDKSQAIYGEGITEQRYFARAVVFSFIEENLREFFPPEIMTNLRKDLNNAHDEFDLLSGIAEKMQFIPSGIDVWPAYDIDERNPEDWNLAYKALKEEFAISVEYDSLHKPDVECVHLSPQNVQYANHKVVLQCYVHDTGKVKNYEVSRLLNVQRVDGLKFHKVNFAEFEQEYDFEAIVSVGVKNYFDSVKFGRELSSEQGEEGTWVIKCKVSIPEHFSSGKSGPDPFALTNFLSNFSYAMEVIKPDFLREEMKKRADNLSKIYSSNHNSLPIIAEKPYEVIEEESS